MKDVAPIVVLNPIEGFQEPPDGHLVVKDFKIDICGEPIHLQIGIRDQQATLVDMIPVARSLVSQIVRIALKQIHKTGSTIPCGQGCSACCSHLIPLALPEAVYLAEAVMGMQPERRTETERRCWEIANQVEESFPDFLAIKVAIIW
jgi:hypothetical protein